VDSLPTSKAERSAVSSVWRGSWRLWRASTHILAGLLTIFLRFPRLTQEQREIRVQVWSREMLARLGIRLMVTGNPTLPGPLLLVANHISWLDITALHAARFCRFVSKADVRHWPLIGALAAGVGTLFIERASRRDAMRVVHYMAERLRAGEVLAVFPEGTTSDGVQLLPFHGNLLQAAIASDAPVQPVALAFVDSHSGERSLAPCYVGDDTLLGSVWRTVCASGITVRITFGEVQPARGRDRRAWAVQLREQIEQMR
jgi:1-acyl-sn-glycerol-3-phosphate acyltransferase